MICGWQIGNALQQTLQIHHGAANKYWFLLRLQRLLDGSIGICHKIRGGITFRRIKNIYQLVRVGGQFFWGWLGGTYVHAAIDKRRIGTDQLHLVRTPQCILYRHGNRGLANSSRPAND